MQRALTIILLILGFSNLYGQQNVGIGTTNPNPKALLDLTAVDKGILIPRLTTTGRLAINPQGTTDEGLLVYDIDDQKFYYWNASAWVAIPMSGLSGFNVSLSFDSTTGVLSVTDAGGTLSTTINVNDDDPDPTNELQVLSLSNDTLFLSNGGFVVLPNNVVNTDDQTLSISGDTLSIANGNSVVLPTSQGIPLLTQAQISATNPFVGMTVYNLTTNTINVYDGISWTQLSGYFIGTNVTNGGTPCPGTPTVTIQGEVYPTVQIGSQCWMAKNLNLGTMLDISQPSGNNGVIEKYCFDNDTANCSAFGAFYAWSELMGYSMSSGAQGICPNGWHLPTSAEFDTLINNLGGGSVAGTALQENGGSGFNFVLAGSGYQGSTTLPWQSLGYIGVIWGSDIRPALNILPKVLSISGGSPGASNSFSYTTYLNNCRCIKD